MRTGSNARRRTARRAVIGSLAVLSLAVGGCSSGGGASGSAASGSSGGTGAFGASSQPAESGQSGSAAQSSGDSGKTLAQIKSTGTMTVGVRFSEPPYGYVPQGKSDPIGFSIDLSTAIGKHLGAKQMKWVEVTAQNRIPYLTSGKVDMLAASILIKPDRAKKVAFTIPAFQDVDKILVQDSSSINGTDDLSGKTVGVTQGAAQKDDVKKVAPGVNVREFQTWPLALTAMFQGQIDGVVATTGILIGLEQTANDAGKKVKIVGDGFAPGYVAPAVRKDDPAMLKAVNDALLAMEKDGTYGKIFKKWWGNAFAKPYHIHKVDDLPG